MEVNRQKIWACTCPVSISLGHETLAKNPAQAPRQHQSTYSSPNKADQTRWITFKRQRAPELFLSWQGAEATAAGARCGDVG